MAQISRGAFDPTVLKDGWFDPSINTRGGWFDRDGLDAAIVAIAGVGPAGSATFVLDLEAGAEVTYSWATDLMKPLNGLEQRVSLGDAPQQRYQASAFLVDGDERTVRSALLFAAATGQPFLLALPFEELQLSADATGATLPVWSTTLSDWASNPGQRVALIAPDDTRATGVVQSSTATTVVIDPAPGATAGKSGGRLMPTMAIYLEPSQGLSRHPIIVSHWKIDAQAALFGYANIDQMGVGAVVNTYDGFPLYDERISIDETIDNSLLTLGDILDTGALPLAVGGATVVDQTRQIRIESDAVATWQWFKRFIFTVKGRFAAFLKPTWQPDLVFHSNPGSAQLLVKSASVAGAGNYLATFNGSLAHRRLQIVKTDGSIQYVTVATLGDNGDGTLTLNLNATVTGTVDVISFLETCRLESDDVRVRWSSFVFSSEIVARVVQQ